MAFQSTTGSEPVYAKEQNKKKDLPPFYTPNIDKYIAPETRRLFEEYAGIPPAELSQHVHEMRDKAWAIRAYPCTGLGVWLIPFLPHSSAYRSILHRLQSGGVFLDIGCHLGGDMRSLAFSSAPTERMYGVDIASHWDVGLECYRDAGRFKATFIEADFLSTENAALEGLRGKVDVVSVSAVLHQWDWDKQVEAAKRLVEFSKVGTLVVGHQIGNVEAQRVENKALKVMAWRQNAESFAKMWEVVSEETGTKWETEARLREFESLGWDSKDKFWMEAGATVLDFVVTRTA